MSRVRQSKRRVNSIIPDLLKKDFIENLKDWWYSSYPKDYLFVDIRFRASCQILKKFQREKSPELLGKAISINPLLLDHFFIRSQIINWMIETIQSRKIVKESRKNITLFVKGLIPRAVRRPVKLKAVLDTKGLPEAIKTCYHKFRKDIQEEFDKFAEQNKRKPKHQGEIAPILKRIFKNPGIKLENERTINQFLEGVADKKKKKPSEIALLILREALKENGYNIGTRLLKKLISR